jgi:hypothetical protein
VGYKTAWLILHQLRQATVRAERSPLTGKVEGDETCVGGQASGVMGRQLVDEARVVSAVDLEGKTAGAAGAAARPGGIRGPPIGPIIFICATAHLSLNVTP